MTTVARVLSLLPDARPAGERQWSARCPAHEDAHASLSVSEGEGGKALLHCHAGCTKPDVLKALGLTARDLFPQKPTATGARKESRGRIVKTYDYRDAAGVMLFQCVKYEPKDFRQRRPDGRGDWIWNLNGTPRILYRLPELLAADPGQWVFIAEGEKDVENLRAVGVVATCNPMGAGKWKKVDASPLQSRRVCIIPDRDVAGRKHALDVAGRLHGRAAEVRILELPGDGKDATDFLDGHDAQDAADLRGELLRLAESAPVWEATPATPAEPDPLAFALTDSGNAELLAVVAAQRLRFDTARGRWRHWPTGAHYWREEGDAPAVAAALEVARLRYQAAGRLEPGERKPHAKWAMLSESRARLEAAVWAAARLPGLRDSEPWDGDPLLLGCENAIVDLRTGQPRPGRPEDRLTTTTGIVYDPAATCPRWLRFLEEIFCGDGELIAFIERAAGYSLSGDTSEQCFFLCHGLGANGKTVYLNTLRHVAGQYGCDTGFSTFEAAARATIPCDLAALEGKRVVTASETAESVRLNEARVKCLTGQDAVTARHMYGSPFTFTPRCKVWLACNHKPTIRDDSPAMWRRVKLLPFLATFEGEAADPKLGEALRNEAAGILRWAVAGAVEWQRRGLGPPPCVTAATREYQGESDVLAPFIEAACAVHCDATALSGELYGAYRQWARSEGIRDRDELSHVAFTSRLRGRFPKRHTRRGAEFQGIGIRAETLPGLDVTGDGLGGGSA